MRDQCSWVHQNEPEEATRKAKDLIKMTIAKARLLESLEPVSLGLVNKALIVGGGLAGMTAALSIAGQGFEVHLVEKEAELGGYLRNMHYTLAGDDIKSYLSQTIDRVMSDELIYVYTNAEVESIDGVIGNFLTTLTTGKGDDAAQEQIEHGAVIVATGGTEFKPKEYLYGEDERVLTQQELECKIQDSDLASSIQNVVMIQCVGSRCEERPYCSRICCINALKNALKLKELNPEINIYIIYKDLRAYGYAEDYYTQARENGVFFIRYDDDNKPEVLTQDGELLVSVYDTILGEPLVLEADLVALSTAVLPADDNEKLAKMLKVPLTHNGFFLEAHVKLRPIDFSTDGVYLCGTAHSPMTIEECISQASGAAARATVLISKDSIVVAPIISVVDEERCAGCGLCETVCQFNAIQLTDTDTGRFARVTAASCKGCGTCGASCPQLAISMKHFTDEQLLAQVDALAFD